MAAPQSIAILDFGSQLTKVIARRVRECNVHSRIYPFSVTPGQLRADGVAGIILSGGPDSVKAKGSPHPHPGVFEMGLPVLGICYGVQLMGQMLGGNVASSSHREYGHGTLSFGKGSLLLQGLKSPLRVWNSHGDKVTRLPRGFKAVARTENSECAVIEDSRRRFFGIQFHPEVVHSPRGREIIANYVHGVCGSGRDWTMRHYVEQATED
ncbi:MAG: glutamine-hydrolyzing GMP synthase, partial [Verrucomicrobiota bacterium]